jgi:hypothetical protein
MDVVVALRQGVARTELPLLRGELVALLDQLCAKA